MDANTEKTAGSNLTPIAEYTETAAALADLRERHAGVIYEVTVPKEMRAAKEARAELRTLRTSLEKKRVEIKAPALERCRLIDAEAKRITAELVALEEPIDVQIKTEEARAETARLEKLEAERLRVEAIQKKIQAIRDVPPSLVGKPSVIIAGQLAKLRETVLDEDEFGADYITATDALTAAIARVTELLAAQQEADAEKKRQAERDAEMKAMQEKLDAQQRLIDEAEEAKRVEQERLAQVERDRVAAEEAAARAAEQAERDRIAAEETAATLARWAADNARIEAERAEQEAALQAERERQAAEQRKLDEQAAQLKRDQQASAKKAEADRLATIGLREAAEAAVAWFVDEGHDDVQVCTDLKFALSNDTVAQIGKPARTKRAARG